MNFYIIFKEKFKKSNNLKVLEVNNKKREINKIETALEYSQYDLSDIEESIIKEMNKAQKDIMLSFYDYIYKNYDVKIETDLIKRFFDSKKERDIDILKNFQNFFSIYDIVKYYNLDEKKGRDTINKEIRSIQNLGINLLGFSIKPDVENVDKTRKRYFMDKVHPIFMPLNTIEVYALLKFLPDLLEEYYKCFSDDEKIKLDLVHKLIEKMQFQLSHETKEKFNINVYDDIELKFTPTEETRKTPAGRKMFISKMEGLKNNYIIKNIKNNTEKEYQGVYYESENYIITTNGKHIEINEDEIVKII